MGADPYYFDVSAGMSFAESSFVSVNRFI